MPVTSETPTVDSQLKELFENVENKFKSTNLKDGSWYLVAMTCIAASPDPELSAQLYLYLRDQEGFPTPESRQQLVRRLREVLVKSISLIGVCKPIESVVAISKVEREEDRDYSSSREGWQADAANHERAMNWFKKVYTRNAGDTMGIFDAHKDFAWISAEITYGLYLSDRQVLDDVETQLVVLPAIMMQNLPLESHWHIRGTRRIGVSKEDTQVIWDCVHLIAAYFGVKLHKVPTVDEVEPDV